MSVGGGSSGSSKSTTTQTPWGPQQGYLQDIFGRAQNLENWYAASPQQSPLFGQYINQAVQQSQQGLQPAVSNAWGQALGATGPGSAYAQAIANSGNDPYIGHIIDTVRQSGYTPNAAMPYAGDVIKDIGAHSANVYNQGQSIFDQVGTNTGISQNLQNILAGTGSLSPSFWGNPAISGLQTMAGSQWSDPYAAGLTQSGLAATANPYMQQLAQSSGAYNPYVSGTANAASLAMRNPALADLMETAQGKYLTPDTNPYLKDAVQAAQDQTLASIASQFNQGGRYGSGMMAGIQAKELGNIANQAYSGAYESERARQEAARQALGGQYLQGVGQVTAGQQAAGQLAQGQQQLGLQGIGAAGQLYGTGMGQLLSGLQAAGGLAGQQQQLGQQALAEAGQQYGAAGTQALNAKQLQGQIAQNQVQNTLNSYNQLMQAQNQRAQQELAGGQLLGGLSESDLNRQLSAQQQAAQDYLQNIGLRTNAQQNAANTYLQSLGIQTGAMNFAPVVQGMQQSNLGQLANAAQIQQQLMQMPEQQQWGNLANYLAMVQGNYGGVGTSKTPYYQNQAGSAMGGALGGAGLGMMLGGPWGAAAGGGLGLLGGMFG